MSEVLWIKSPQFKEALKRELNTHTHTLKPVEKFLTFKMIYNTWKGICSQFVWTLYNLCRLYVRIFLMVLSSQYFENHLSTVSPFLCCFCFIVATLSACFVALWLISYHTVALQACGYMEYMYVFVCNVCNICNVCNVMYVMHVMYIMYLYIYVICVYVLLRMYEYMYIICVRICVCIYACVGLQIPQN